MLINSILITWKMMRYRGKFQRAHYPQLVIEATDEGTVLETKWKTWSELEAWKRFAITPSSVWVARFAYTS
jgi:hypothetical protein